jgi:hypothetical protein
VRAGGGNTHRAHGREEANPVTLSGPAGIPPAGSPWYKKIVADLRNRYVLWAIALLAAFLLGLLPQYFRTRGLRAELREANLINQRMHLRDLAALAYVRAAQKNYGLAAQAGSEFFDQAQKMAAQAETAERRKMYEEIYSRRDQVIAGLAKGDPAVLEELQNVYLKTRAATEP